MDRIITLVAGSERTKNTLSNQLKEYLDEGFNIVGYAIDEGDVVDIEGELVVLSSEFIYQELLEKGFNYDDKNFIVANRTINNDYLDKVVAIPDGTNVLFVNELPKIVLDVIEHLKEIGISHLNYSPYYPGLKDVDRRIRVAITPGETLLVPDFIEEVYDIGPRIMDFTTITKILNRLGILDEKAGQFSQRYLEKTIKISRRLAESKNEISKLNKHLETVIDGVTEGLLVFDEAGTISVSNENINKIIPSKFAKHISRNIVDIIKDDDLLRFLCNEESDAEQVFKINSSEYLVSKIRMANDNFMIAKFKSIKDTLVESDRLKRELVKKGFYAKFEIEDIIGNSDAIKKTKEISKKLAKSDLTILLNGESGSGKELFASAIHNESNRRRGPFLAVNFSALPDDLIESELFGYEEGAFTGAKKGGKVGLFEQADGGTIFLDEIGDISKKLQARLLRVLQEKEVMRIGGNEIKPIDVRVVSATNRNLYEMVKNNEFREDLYYRLKMGYIRIPPLRERKEDIPQLIHYISRENMYKRVIFDDQVIQKFCEYDWFGNIRELKNTIDYMIAISSSHILTIDEFPSTDFFQTVMADENAEDSISLGEAKKGKDENDFVMEYVLNDEYMYILNEIYRSNQKCLACGRVSLAQNSMGTKYEMTQYQMRTRLNFLLKKGFINIYKGKRGTEITSKGIRIIKNL